MLHMSSGRVPELGSGMAKSSAPPGAEGTVWWMEEEDLKEWDGLAI